MSNQVSVGDVVCLKSEPSVRMTVEKRLDNGCLSCCWIHNGKKESDAFRPEALEKAAPPKPRGGQIV